MHEEFMDSLDLTSVAKEFVSAHDVHKKYVVIENKLFFTLHFNKIQLVKPTGKHFY